MLQTGVVTFLHRCSSRGSLGSQWHSGSQVQSGLTFYAETIWVYSRLSGAPSYDGQQNGYFVLLPAFQSIEIKRGSEHCQPMLSFVYIFTRQKKEISIVLLVRRKARRKPNGLNLRCFTFKRAFLSTFISKLKAEVRLGYSADQGHSENQ